METKASTQELAYLKLKLKAFKKRSKSPEMESKYFFEWISKKVAYFTHFLVSWDFFLEDTLSS